MGSGCMKAPEGSVSVPNKRSQVYNYDVVSELNKGDYFIIKSLKINANQDKKIDIIWETQL